MSRTTDAIAALTAVLCAVHLAAGQTQVIENEPISQCQNGSQDFFNAGCDSTPTAFTEVALSFDAANPTVEILATTGTFLSPTFGPTRDTDWFRYTVPAGETVTLEVALTPEVDMIVGDADFVGEPEGDINCLADVVFGTSVIVPAGTRRTLTLTQSGGVSGGEFVIIATTLAFEGVPCGTPYTLEIRNQLSAPGLENAIALGGVQVAPAGGAVAFDTIGSTIDTAAAVYDAAGNLLGSNDDISSFPLIVQSSVVFQGAPGESFTAVVTGFPNIQFPDPLGPAGSEGLQAITPSASGDILGAVSTAAGEVLYSGFIGPGGNQFYTFTLEEAPDVFGGCNPADVTEDGELSFADASAFISAFNEGDIAGVGVDGDASADTNRDGELSFADASGFIAAFNEGCP